MKVMKFWVICFLFLVSFSLVVAESEYSIDISGLRQEGYSIGDELTFTLRLLKNDLPVSAEVEVVFADALEKKEVRKKVQTNEETSILIGDDFPSLEWYARAAYEDVVVERTFFVKGNTEVEFLIEDGDLIIRNNGNVRYTRTIQITIGDEVQSLTQNIRVGGEKKYSLTAPEGKYNIKVTDGETTLTRSNVDITQTIGTGNVIGAVDEALVGYAGLGGAGDPENLDERFFSTERWPVAIVFVVAVFVLGILLFVARRYKTQKND